MKHAHTLSVGFVLAIALCGQAKAVDAPLLDSPVWAASETPQTFTFAPVPEAYPMSATPDVRTRNLALVHKVASEVGNQEVMQAMLLQESGGGTHTTMVGNPRAPVSKRSYGLMQVQVVAARSVLQRYSQLMADYFPNRDVKRVRDGEIIKLLMTNPIANIRMAAYHFNLYLSLVDGEQDAAIAAYNVGIGGVKKLKAPSQYKYVVEVKHKLNTVVKPFNTMYGLDSTPNVVTTQY
jgi:hypothetical protein